MLNLLTIKFSVISLLYIRHIYYMNTTRIKLLVNNLTKYVLIVACLILRLTLYLLVVQNIHLVLFIHSAVHSILL